MLQNTLAVKISLDLLKGLWSYAGFKLTGCGYPQIFSTPIAVKLRQIPKSFRGARTCSRSSITMPSLVGLGFHPLPGRPKTFRRYGALKIWMQPETVNLKPHNCITHSANRMKF